MGSCCGVSADAKSAFKTSAGQKMSLMSRMFNFAEAASGVLKHPIAIVISGISLVASFMLNGHGCHGESSQGLLDPAWVALVICGVPLLKEAVLAVVIERKIRASLLISTAMVACVTIGQLFAAGEVAFIMALGEKLEDWTVKRARKGLGKLVSLAPTFARKVVTCPKCRAKGEFFREVAIEEIEVGEAIMVKPGETIPVDGVVIEGATTVDQSVMTGESLPVDKAVDDEVYSGTINMYGAITIRVTKAGEDSSLQKLVRIVKEAETKKAPMQRIADKWASILVPCSMTIALLTFIGCWFIIGDVQEALTRGVTIMVVFCPCALVLATPTSVMAAIGQATKYGVMIKSGEALERMGEVDVACLDKTGTLTNGKLSVVYSTSDEVLSLAAGVEEKSEHSLAKAICEAAKGKCLSGAQGEVCDFEMKPGRGVAGSIEGRKVVCGTEAWLKEFSVELGGGFAEEAQRLRGEGKAVIYVAVDGVEAGFIALADTVRETASAALEGLARAKVRTCLLTGDHRTTAQFVARSLGILDVRAELMPADKARVIEEIQNCGSKCCMVGDGVNDAVALATAHVGVAMCGAGSDIAVEAADVAITCGDLSRIAYLKRLSVACVRLIKTNIAISMTINAIAISASVLGLLTPVAGALVHNLGSALVILNGALLYDRKYI